MTSAFKLGDRVTKKSGSAWSGIIVGTYSTKLTPEGYAIESLLHPGSVQIYPAAALRLLEVAKPTEDNTVYTLEKWDLRYLRMAKEVSGWSNDPVKKVGCVLTNKLNRVVSTGCNGVPAGMDKVALPREQVKIITLHAEVNALLDCTRPFHNCYVWDSLPCAACMAQLAQAGCKRIIGTKPASDEWYPDLSALIAAHYKIEVLCYDVS